MPRTKSRAKGEGWGGSWQPTAEERAQFRRMMTEMVGARIEMFAANSARFAEALGAFRASLIQSGFSAEESLQIILRVAEMPGGGPMFGRGFRGHVHKG
jgi:hypothetical protein